MCYSISMSLFSRNINTMWTQVLPAIRPTSFSKCTRYYCTCHFVSKVGSGATDASLDMQIDIRGPRASDMGGYVSNTNELYDKNAYFCTSAARELPPWSILVSLGVTHSFNF